MTPTEQREEVVDFTYPYYTETVTLVSRAPRQRVSEFAAFSPFSPTTWICIILSLLCMGPILVVESWIVKTYRGEEHVGYDISSSSFNIFRVLMKQEDLLTTKYWPSRLTSLFWYFFCFIVAALYSSMLTATLVKPSFEKPIDGLNDLPAASKDGFTLVVAGNTVYEYMFKIIQSPGTFHHFLKFGCGFRRIMADEAIRIQGYHGHSTHTIRIHCGSWHIRSQLRHP
ncbi:glutamate receptor ionotropic, kainate glr-3-like [Palaemon carinicauda]|uniref:glutamate receptor ionotropic, kainate glr-3-like n=1 Tax=Palaemon carinicauda TaxID=392227 RepID=UPI0035B5C5D6